MVTPEEDKARIERARAEAQERREFMRRYWEIWDKGIDPLTGESLNPDFKRLVDKMVEYDRSERMRPYDVGRGTNRVRTRTGGRNRRAQRG